jgi:hypothetical protein
MRPLLLLLSAAAKVMAVPGGQALLAQTQGEYEDELDGIALFPGIVRGDTRFGVLLAGRANGDLPGTWAGTVNYRSPWVVPGLHHDIVDGSWYFRAPEGALFGRIVEGRLLRDDTCRYAEVELTVEITGGRGAFEGATGIGVLAEGVVDHASRVPRFTARQTVALQRIEDWDD